MFVDEYGGPTLLGAITAFIVIFALIVGGAFYFDWKSCHESAEAMGRDGRWSRTPGVPCMVQGDDGRYIPLEQYREAEGR